MFDAVLTSPLVGTDNLFTALRSYTPTVGRDPREDFITEAFAWLLRRHTELADAVLTFIAQQPGGMPGLGEDVVWKTQVTVDGGRIDMVADFGEHGIVFEHKVWSPLGPGQIDKYRAAASSLWPGRHIVVLITASTRQHEQTPDVALTWADVYRVIDNWRQSRNKDPELVVDFLGLLADEGLAPPSPISHEAILSYLPAKGLEESVLAVVREATKADWTWFYKRISWPGQNPRPYLRGSRPEGLRDGRAGVDLLPGWRPGIFVGAMLDGSDHGVQPSAATKGPDFCLVLSFHRDDGVPPRDEYLGSAEFQELRTRLAREAGNWDFLDRSAEHAWHLLHLRKPMLEVFRGSLTFEEQVERFLAQSRAAIDVLLAGGELEALRTRLGA